MQKVDWSMKVDHAKLYAQRKERMETTVNLKIPDRVPVIFSENEFAWGYANVSQKDFMTNNDKMMLAYEKIFKDFQPDAAFFHPYIFDSLISVVDAPCKIKFPGVDLPEDSPFQFVESEIMMEEDYKFASRRGYLATLIKLLPKLRPEIPNVQQVFTARTSQSLESMRTSASNFKKLEEWGIPLWNGGGMESPFSLLSLMRSYENFVLDIYRHKEIVKKTVERFIKDIIYLCIGGVKSTGVHRSHLGLHRESSSNFSLKIFEEIAFPMIKKIVELLSNENIMTILHCDGDWAPNLPYLAELPKGKCILDIDDSTDIFKAKEIVGDKMCIAGNLHEPLFVFGTPQKVEERCKKLIDVVGEGGGFILKGEPPHEAKPENIKAMINTAKKYGIYKA